MRDLIGKQAAINALIELSIQRNEWDTEEGFAQKRGINAAICAIEELSTAQPPEIQDILDYLDTALHPIISPEYWNVYSELYDMISMLPPAERHGQWKDIPFTARWICSNCDYISEFASFKYCPDCGARMEGEEE